MFDFCCRITIFMITQKRAYIRDTQLWNGKIDNILTQTLPTFQTCYFFCPWRNLKKLSRILTKKRVTLKLKGNGVCSTCKQSAQAT